MAITPEGKVKNLLKKAIAPLDCWIHWPVTHGYGYSGDPDCIFLYNGTLYGVEVKAPGRRTQPDRGRTKMQVKRMAEIEKSGGKSFVVDCQEEIDALMREVLG